MKKTTQTLFVFVLSLTLQACNGGLETSSSITDPKQPAINIDVPMSAYQDREYFIDLSSVDSLESVELINAPSWLTYNHSAKIIRGIPDDNLRVTNLRIVVHKKNGNFESLGPYFIKVHGDPLRQYQWHIENVGQSNFATNPGAPGNDINQSQALLNGVTGNSIKIAVSDSGVEINHEDLSANIIPGASKDYNLPPPYFGNPTPSGSHGTAVAGIIGAAGWNGKGGRGVAPNSKIAGLKFLSTPQSVAMRIDQASGPFDIFNYSYGLDPYQPPNETHSYLDQLRYGTENQRDGKGAIYVKSAGNEYYFTWPDSPPYLTLSEALDWCPIPFHLGGSNYICEYMGNSNFGGNENSAPEVIVVGALDAKGRKSSYSSPGSNLWISAPGGEYGSDDPAIMTTDLQGCSTGHSVYPPANSFQKSTSLNPGCKYTSTMNGTSSAAPIVSGAIALILEANPDLSWRDIKYILAATATKNDPLAGNSSHELGYNLVGHTYQNGWVQNSAGFWFHNWYGFGRVNVDNAIALAKNYGGILNPLRITQSNNGSWYYSSGSISQAIPDNSAAGTSSSIDVRHNLIIESVQVKFSTVHPYISDLGVELTSPSGTKSILLNINSGIERNNTLSYDAIVSSNAFLGESSNGSWTLKVVDGYTGGAGSLAGWMINIYGHNNPDSTDTTPPSPPSGLTMSPYFNSTSSAPPASFTPSASPDVLRYEYSIGTQSGQISIREWTPIALNNSISATGLTLVNGSSYFLNVRAIDTSENISSNISQSWVVDTTPPVNPTFSNFISGQDHHSASITINGTCEPGSGISVTPGTSLSVSSASCDSNGDLEISFTIDGSWGARSFTVILTDPAGNQTSNNYSFLYYTDPAPSVLSVSPSSGTSEGGDIINVTGSGFTSGVVVKIDGESCTNVSVSNASLLTCKTPSSDSTGMKELVVTNLDNQSGKKINGYEYLPIWSEIDSSPLLGGRIDFAHVKMNDEVFVWGGATPGSGYSLETHGTGAIYSFATKSWRPITNINAPSARASTSAVWTGNKVIVWGGTPLGGISSNSSLNDGFEYDPTSDTWSQISSVGVPSARRSHTAIWTGSHMIIWGGYSPENLEALNDGAKYDPILDLWSPIATPSIQYKSVGNAYAWTGSKMIIWGGHNLGGATNTGAIYDFANDSWANMSTTSAPSARYDFAFDWTGSQLFVWGGRDQNTNLSSGGLYDPSTDTWSTLPPSPLNSRYNPTAIYCNNKIIVFGGAELGNLNKLGAIYKISQNLWNLLPEISAPTVRSEAVGKCNDNELWIWGGTTQGYSLGHKGGIYLVPNAD